MNEPTRREKIEAFLADDPQDVFLRYSLAMELWKEGAHDASLERFGALMAQSPGHVPAFFMAAKLLVEIRRPDEACGVLRDGIEQARQQGEHHAASEMGEFLMALSGGASV